MSGNNGFMCSSFDSSNLPAWLVNHPDNPPAIANPMDDEFDGNTLSSVWTPFATAGALDSAWVDRGRLYMGYTTNSTESKRRFGIWQKRPAGRSKFRTKVNIESAGFNYVSAMMCAGIAATNRVVVSGLMHFNNNITLYYLDLNGDGVTSEGALTYGHGLSCYLQIEFTDTEVIWSHSTSGIEGSYFYYYKFPLSLYAVDMVGLYKMPYSESAVPEVSSFEWFRRVA